MSLRPDLVADCASCAAVCCVATSFEACDDFAFAKAAGERCRHLGRDGRCGIHRELAARGCSGCAIYDCHGAGPRVTRAFADQPDAGAARDQAFLVLRVIHELLWLLTEAAKLCPDRALSAQLARQIDALDVLAAGPAATLAEIDLRPHHQVSRTLLRRVGDTLGGRRVRGALVVLE
jgi:hypothetical protein